MTDSATLLFWSPLAYWWLPPAALILDVFIPDPPRFPHPVQGVGKLADMLARPGLRAARPVLTGALAAFAVLCLSGGLAALLAGLPLLGPFLALYLSWAGMALGGLVREGEKALRLIRDNNMTEARAAVGMLVSRDTSTMDEADLCRSLAESVSENLGDAFFAPFFWLLLSGPVGLWVYKAASTLDSMWGYTTEPWRLFGRAAARTDDVLAYIPSRLAALFLYLSSPLCARAFHWPGWKTVRRQAKTMKSPNAGWPMASAAWLHGAPMGGPTPYHGQVVEKPLLGPEKGEWTPERIQGLIRHVRMAGILGGVVLWGAVTLGWILAS